MRQLGLALIAAVLFAPLVAQAKPSFEAIVAKDKESKPTSTFSTDVEKIMTFFRSKGSQAGDKVRGVWIADDVGDVAPANTKIDEATVTCDQADCYGAFSLSRPTNGWPQGKYHVDIYDGDALVTSVKFTIAGDDKKKDAAEDVD